MNVKVVDTTLRDGQQSLLATRMTTEEIMEVAPILDEVGFYSMEVWGGATFDAPLRYLGENPWDRLDAIRKALKNTKIQMLLRGQNLVGYRHYADDVVELFVKTVKKHGMDIVRIFDALNDVRNMKKSIEVAKGEGMHVQIALSYTVSPVHTVDYYVSLAKDVRKLGADSIAIKDMAGILLPKRGIQLAEAIKDATGLPVELHTHSTGGVGPTLIYEAIVSHSVDIVDTGISPLAMGTAQPSIQTLYYMLKDAGVDLDINIDVVHEASKIIKNIVQRHNPPAKVYMMDPMVLKHQVPGGMLSNLIAQLKAMNAEDRLEEVLEEVPRVRKDLGYPPLVTPMSQIVGTQAVLNVIKGERYAMVTKELKNYIKGLYGKPPAPIDSELVEKVLGDEKQIDVRPADLLEPELPKARRLGAPYIESDEDLLIVALFPEQGLEYLKKRAMKKYGVDEELVVYDDDVAVYPVP